MLNVLVAIWKWQSIHLNTSINEGGFCKAVVKSEEPETTPEPIVQQKPKPITEDTVNDYIKQNPDIVTNYPRNERAMQAQRNKWMQGHY